MGLAGFITSKVLRRGSESAKSENTLTRVSMVAIALGMAVMTISIMVVTGFKREIEDKVRALVQTYESLNSAPMTPTRNRLLTRPNYKKNSLAFPEFKTFNPMLPRPASSKPSKIF